MGSFATVMPLHAVGSGLECAADAVPAVPELQARLEPLEKLTRPASTIFTDDEGRVKKR